MTNKLKPISTLNGFKHLFLCLVGLSILIPLGGALFLFAGDFIPRTSPANENFTPSDGVVDLDSSNDFRCIFGENIAIYTRCGVVRIFNEDGTKWMDFSWNTNRDAVQKVEHSFSPFSYSPGYDLLVFQIVGRSSNWLEIVVDETNGIKKFVRTSSFGIDLKEWSTHILAREAISSLDQEVFDEPDGKNLGKVVHKEFGLKPIEMQGEWLKMRLVERQSSDIYSLKTRSESVLSNRQFVWVKWREGEKILIDLFYYA